MSSRLSSSSLLSRFCLALRRPLSVLCALAFAAVGHATIGVSLQAQLGNPSGATVDPNNHDHYLLQHDQYVFDFSDHDGGPNWVSWDLTTDDVGGSGRSNNFLPDPDLPNTFYHVVTSDFTGSGYDRGHMCPSADRTITAADNQVTFYLGQIIPQSPDNNQGVWANFEGYCRTLASAGNEVLITSGPSLFSGSRIPSGVAAIPGYTWKIVLVVPLGPGSAVSRVTSSTRVIAIKIPNIAGVRTTPWENFVTSVAQIEADTGFTFLTNLPSPVANALRTVVDGQSAVGSPSITAQPATQTTVVGGNATFSVSATGDAPLSYQWLRNDDEIIPGATSPTLTLSNVQASDLGSYYVVVTNSVGSATSNLAQLVIMGLPPTITTSPTPQTVNAGGNATFSVTASGSPTLIYQWRKNGAPISSATSSALTLSNVQAGDAASYDVVVTNSVNFVTSGAATLAVTPAAPTITGQPAAKTASTGDSVSFTVSANGTAPLTYQWRKDSVALANGGTVSGSTSATLSLTGVSAADAGSYDVIVTNPLNFATSTAATLAVNPPSPSAVTWNFTTADPTSGLSADLLGGTVSVGNNNGAPPLISATSASSGYTGSSGSNNAGAAARIGALSQALNGSAYFEFTLSPSAGKRLLATGLSFGMRSTATGPQAFNVFTSLDSYATAIASSSVPNDGNWHLYTPTFTAVTGALSAPITFRIYGSNGVGAAGAGTANWRIDDLKLTINAVFPPAVAPVVVSTTPLDSAGNVPVSTPITITFNEGVSFLGSWFSITSANLGPISASVTGGPTTFTLAPPSFFANTDTITVTIFGAQIVDQASGAIHGTANTTFTFTTEAFVPPTQPTVTTQPATQTVNAGSAVSFSVGASGTPPFSYQWRKNGTALTNNSSALTATLTLTDVTTADAGSFDCVVSNVAGSDLSHAASLTVLNVPPTITTPPSAQIAAVGGSASFTVTAAGTTPFTYQWRKDGTPLMNGANVSGADTATLTLTNLAVADSGAYDVVVTNAANTITSSAANLAVSATASSTYYWDFATDSPTTGSLAGVTGGKVTQGNNNGSTTLITAVSVSSGYTGFSAGNNAGAAARIGALNQGLNGSAYFEFTFTPPAGQQFAATAISFGMRSTATGPQAFSIFSSADNYAAPVASSAVVADALWHFYTPVFSGVTGAAGVPVTFRLFGYNGLGSPATGTANWRIDDLKLTAGLVATSSAPSIDQQPVAQSAMVGGSASFSVAASGSGTLTYQWRKNGVNLTSNPSATTSTLTLASVTAADGGSYDCVVSNSGGSTPSTVAVLTVTQAPATVTLGSLNVTYDGAAHSATATTNPAGLTVVFSYNGNSTVPTNAGSYAVVATIADLNYAGSTSGTLVIAKAPATITLGQTTQAWDNTPKSVSVTTNPSGLGVTVLYNGSTTVPTRAGRYNAAATINDPNYTGFAGATFTITPSPATVTLSNLQQAYDGTPKSVTVTTSPAALDFIVFYNDSNVPPTNPGTYTVVATAHSSNYSGTATGQLVITATALVRHAPSVNGGIDGSLQMLSAEKVALNSSSYISGDLLAPGTPSLVLNSHPTYGGTEDGTGSATPADYTVTLNSGALLRHVVRRTDAISLPTVNAPPAPIGTRNVSLNAGQSPGDFATIRNLTLNSNVGQIALPAGTYGSLTANSHSGFTLGVANATEPAIYNLQGLTLNSNAQIQILGPVIITTASGVTINSGSVGETAHPEWLSLNLASSGLTLNSAVTFYGSVCAPNGTITLNGSTTLKGNVIADRLTINGNALLDQP